jgi:hypothetical protein
MFRVNLKGFGAMLHRRKVAFCGETIHVVARKGDFVSRAKQIVAAMQKLMVRASRAGFRTLVLALCVCRNIAESGDCPG